MALATICPHCNTTFRVASDQLKLRGGIVRCGACNEVFDGNAALIDLDAGASPPASETAPPLLPEPTAAAPITPPEQSASAAFDAEIAVIDAKEAEAAEEAIYTLDFDTTFDPFGVLPKPEPEPEPEPEAELAPEPEVEAALAAEPEPLVDEEIVAMPLPEEDEASEAEHELLGETPDVPDAPVRDEGADLFSSLLMRESAAAESESDAHAASKSVRRNAAKRKKAAQRSAEPAEPPEFEPEAEPEPEPDEPEFVRRSRLQEQTGRTRRLAMGAGSALLVLALAAQGMATFRNVLAARYPELKPALSATCSLFGCRVELPAQIEALSVETGELQSLSANTFTYSTLLRNPGTLVQAWPQLELTLTDADDKALVRRVFAPADYLPKSVAAAKGFGARSEQPVKLFFELNQIKASGYHVAIFYP
jgi:predicted Zn finger-like uncharacterized protein